MEIANVCKVTESAMKDKGIANLAINAINKLHIMIFITFNEIEMKIIFEFLPIDIVSVIFLPKFLKILSLLSGKCQFGSRLIKTNAL